MQHGQHILSHISQSLDPKKIDRSLRAQAPAFQDTFIEKKFEFLEFF